MKNFIEEIQGDFYADLNILKEAFEQKRIFNIIHYKTGFKIDLIIKKQGDYYDKELGRRKAYKFGDKIFFFASAEDIILSKLLWSKFSSSERQFQDALGVAKVQKDMLDYEYLTKSADVLKVNEPLKRLLKEIGKEIP